MIYGNSTIQRIAAGYQSPGTTGRYMAQLASTGQVDRDDIIGDIHRTMSEFDQSKTMTEQVESELHTLTRWALGAIDH